MYYLSKEDAEKDTLPCEKNIILWRAVLGRRHISPCNTQVRPSAFKIRRDNQGAPKEPSASLFQNKTPQQFSCSSPKSFFEVMDKSNRLTIKPNCGAATISSEEVKNHPDLTKSTAIFYCSEEHKLNIACKTSCLIHWDLDYNTPDSDQEEHIAGLLAHICRFHIKKDHILLKNV